MQGRKTSPSDPGAIRSASRHSRSYASPPPAASTSRSTAPSWSRNQRRFPPETNPGFSISHDSGSAWGWHSTSIVGSAWGSPEAAHTGSAVPTTSHTSPGAYTPAPSVAAISSPQPTTTVVDRSRPVAAANSGVTVPAGSVPGTTDTSSDSSSSAASSSSLDHERVRGSSRATEEAFEASTQSSPDAAQAA